MPSKNGSVFVYNQPLFSRFLSSLVANIGVKVKATKEDIVTEPAITILNSLNKRPVHTFHKDNREEHGHECYRRRHDAKNISFAPSIPASFGSIPCSMRT